jgi:hypothetical protein
VPDGERLGSIASTNMTGVDFFTCTFAMTSLRFAAAGPQANLAAMLDSRHCQRGVRSA